VKWLLVVVTGAYGAGALVMFTWLLPSVGGQCGQPPLDGRFQWGQADAAAFAEACGPLGLAAYRMLQSADLVYPALLGLTLICWAWVVVRPGWGRRLIVVFALVNVCADYAENVAAWTMLGAEPGWWDAPIFVAMPVVTVVKNLAGTAAFVGLAAAVVVAARRWLQRRQGVASG
jgi:hypothetical protein